MTPARIQRPHTKDWRPPANAVDVRRGTPWGSPWVVGHAPTGWSVNWAGAGPSSLKLIATTDTRYAAHQMAVGLYREYAERTAGFTDRARVELAGRNVMCWCPPHLPCHADVLLEIANRGAVR
ncbi:DUF4326 domain-containing protein [Streptomyces sp. NPDC014801]|uniref:DUF4326 domain-containing protein n=1 Tax=Streptomyces sp. NPDC014801 TaxID=3364916 RepID=UPI0036F9BB94